ncbi:MAG: hypothetical protein NTW52_03330 [Planctomycetota bacterium]|nr:hypothetical protein [Planctomycetota bacterium]
MNQSNPISGFRELSRNGFSPILLGSMTFLTSFFTGCCSTPQTYPTPYGSAFPANNMQGMPINSGVYAPPSINSAAMPPGYTAGTVPQGFTVTPPQGTIQGTIPMGTVPMGTVPTGTVPTGSVPMGAVPQSQALPAGTMQPTNPALPPFGAPTSSFPPGYPPTGYPPTGYPPTGYPQTGYPQGVPMNTMIPPSQPYLFGR